MCVDTCLSTGRPLALAIGQHPSTIIVIVCRIFWDQNNKCERWNYFATVANCRHAIARTISSRGRGTWRMPTSECKATPKGCRKPVAERRVPCARLSKTRRPLRHPKFGILSQCRYISVLEQRYRPAFHPSESSYAGDESARRCSARERSHTRKVSWHRTS